MRPANTAQLDKLKARLDALPRDVRDAVKPQLASSSAELAAEMQRLAPKDSGALAASIKVVPGKTEGTFAVEAGGPTAPYALMVEFGTSKAHAQPFFVPAYRALRQKIINDAQRAAKRAVHAKAKP